MDDESSEVVENVAYASEAPSCVVLENEVGDRDCESYEDEDVADERDGACEVVAVAVVEVGAAAVAAVDDDDDGGVGDGGDVTWDDALGVEA